ncbi:MAG: ATP-binding protein [Candidatus Eisenbacteria bacterium]|nr:ATP-binding protein [Candidatus Eisenbacteria bacterium]
MSEPVTTPEVITVRIPSRLDLLGLLDGITARLCERLAFDEDACCQVSMSVIEAGTNAIQHGHGRDASKPVDVTFAIFPDRLEVRVHDTGAGFDLARVNGDVTAPDHLLDARGRGIFIMRSCMDAVEFEFSSAGTTCRLVKRRPAPPGTP